MHVVVASRAHMRAPLCLGSPAVGLAQRKNRPPRPLRGICTCTTTRFIPCQTPGPRILRCTPIHVAALRALAQALGRGPSPQALARTTAEGCSGRHTNNDGLFRPPSRNMLRQGFASLQSHNKMYKPGLGWVLSGNSGGPSEDARRRGARRRSPERERLARGPTLGGPFAAEGSGLEKRPEVRRWRIAESLTERGPAKPGFAQISAQHRAQAGRSLSSKPKAAGPNPVRILPRCDERRRRHPVAPLSHAV